MGLLVPAAAFFGLTIPVIVIFYLLKKKRVDVEIPSCLLWEQVLRDVSASTPWQKLRKNLLLYLQIAAALALALSLMRPYFSRLAGGSSNVIAVIDTSASMRAKDGSPTRFDDAVSAARTMARSLGRRDEMAVITAGAGPSLLVPFTNDRAALEDALAALAPGYGEANLKAALSLAASMLENRVGPEIVVFSDGVVRPVGSDWKTPAGRVRWVKVGKSDDNTAILALATRTSGAGQVGLVRVTHYGKSQYRGTLTVQGDGKPLDRRELEIAGGGAEDIVFDVPSGIQMLQAEISSGGDLGEDDRAWTVVGIRQEVKILLVSKGNVFLEKSLSLRPGAKVFRANPGDPAAPLPAGYDLYVLDGFWPAALPAAPVLALNPPAGSPLAAGAPIQVGHVATVRPDEPVLRFVDLGQVHVRAAVPVLTAGLAPVLESPEAPLLLTGTREGRRFGLFAFDLHDSDLPLRPAFPILVMNLSGWLLGDTGEGGDLVSGAALPIVPAAGARSIQVTDPEGETAQIAPPFPPSAYTVQTPGIYRVVQEVAAENGGKVESVFTVNERSALEAAISPAETLPIPGAESSAPTARAAVQQEAWPYLAWLALALLATEWWVYARGL